MLTWRWVEDTSVEAWYSDHHLFTYVYRPQLAVDESPRPYFHPIRTLTGTPITDLMPEDHTWHLGLSLALPDVSGVNFWGGPSYHSKGGYTRQHNHGQVLHRRWQEEGQTLIQSLGWHSTNDTLFLSESRQISFEYYNAHQWGLRIESILTNRSGADLTFHSPATLGREGAGYGGWFWRGNHDWQAGLVQSKRKEGEQAINGEFASWVAFSTFQKNATILFLEDKQQPYPWFVRAKEYPGVCSAIAFHQPFTLEPKQSITTNWRMIIANGGFVPERFASFIGK